jgi:thiol-disulfide isomerase/thioredoxin
MILREDYKMAIQGRCKRLVLAGLICALVFAVTASVGCRKKPAREGTAESGISSLPAEQPTSVALLGEAKGSLNEILKAAKTWGPAFESSWGKPAPELSVVDIDGKEHRLNKYRGRDVLVIFWATTCGPCRMEIPELIELRNTVGVNKLVMLAISKEDASLLRSFVAQNQINYTVCTSSRVLPSPFDQVEYVPTSFFIDQKGKIKLATTGKLSSGEIKGLLLASGT